MDQLARRLALVAPRRLARLERPEPAQPAALRCRATVAVATPSVLPIAAQVQRWRRSSSMRATTEAGVARGEAVWPRTAILKPDRSLGGGAGRCRPREPRSSPEGRVDCVEDAASSLVCSLNSMAPQCKVSISSSRTPGSF